MSKLPTSQGRTTMAIWFSRQHKDSWMEVIDDQYGLYHRFTLIMKITWLNLGDYGWDDQISLLLGH